jgi:hypothetical protein
VLSLREYFAARFLYRSAGEGDREFDRAVVVRALLPRPYWLNTARFYGGNAKGGEIYELSAAVEAVLADAPTAAACVAAWTLLTDGVFARRPREARKIITALCADQNLPVLLDALDRHDITALPQLPELPADEPDPTWQRLTNAIESSPAATGNIIHVRVLREMLNARGSFTQWWLQHLALAAGTAAQKPWLALAAADEAAAGSNVQVTGLTLNDGAAQLLLNTGAVPGRGTGLEAALLDAVWHGECPDVTSVRSLPAQVAVALSPEAFYTQSDSGFVLDDAASSRRRADAITQLRKTWPAIAEVGAARRFGVGQRGSTFPWVNVSTALTEAIGRCWLASEIAIIGAASSMRLGYSRYPGRSAFGPYGHPSELLGQCRKNSHDTAWWRSAFEETDDELGRAEWTLALWAPGDDTVRAALSALWDEAFAALPVRYARVVRAAAARIARHGWLHSRDDTSDTRYDVHTGPLAGLRHARSTQSAPLGSSSLPSRPPSTTRPAQPADASLLAVARERRWLKVDAQPVYR